MGYLLGFDVGSSSIKASLLDAETGAVVAAASSPETELPISAPKPGFAEQNPEDWWKHCCIAARALREKGNADLTRVEAIGISYQMHGLVLLDKSGKVLRPAIIWCDSRAVSIGDRAFAEVGQKLCLESLLNSPGNFTASKLRWVRENEPKVFAQIDKAMLPGDFIAARLTGHIVTTPSGLSEGIFWNFQEESIASFLLHYFEIDPSILPEIVPTFSEQGKVSAKAAEAIGVRSGIPVSYRAGDQPNNAFSLGVLDPGEIAATAGTSGVIYGVSASIKPDTKSRVNTFLHVNHSKHSPHYGTLLCVNGTGILNSWIRRLASSSGETLPYEQINKLAQSIAPGADNLLVLPYGNGAERSLGNRNLGASIQNISLTRHTPAHIFRAVQEGVVFALAYGLEIMQGMGINSTKIRAGATNMFLSPVFREAISNTTGATVELYDTDGAQGAARGAGVGCGIFETPRDAFVGLKAIGGIEPNSHLSAIYKQIYGSWRALLEQALSLK